jgi:hypothetical protein
MAAWMHDAWHWHGAVCYINRELGFAGHLRFGHELNATKQGASAKATYPSRSRHVEAELRVC